VAVSRGGFFFARDVGQHVVYVRVNTGTISGFFFFFFFA